MKVPCGYVLHNSDYAFTFAKAIRTGAFGDIVQCASYAFSVPLDRPRDTRHLALFRGLSLQATNKIFELISSVPDAALPAMASEYDLSNFTVPYDRFPFTTQRGEKLFYAYCIKAVTHPLPKSVFGPQGVHVYHGTDVPHCGPIWVYKTRVQDDSSDDACHEFDVIQSSLEDIYESLIRKGRECSQLTASSYTVS